MRIQPQVTGIAVAMVVVVVALFVPPVAAGATVLGEHMQIDVAVDGGDPDGPVVEGACPRISGDGRVVVFTSSASNLVSGDTNRVADVFARDVVAGTTSLVSVDATGGAADAASDCLDVSADGRFVLFASDGSDLGGGDAAGRDLFVRDLATGTTRHLRPGAIGVLSGAGTVVAAQRVCAGGSCGPACPPEYEYPALLSFRCQAGWDVVDLATGETRSLTPDPDHWSQRYVVRGVSDDGTRVLVGWSSFDGEFLTDMQLTLHDVRAGTVRLLEENAYEGVLSGDGDTVVTVRYERPIGGEGILVRHDLETATSAPMPVVELSFRAVTKAFSGAIDGDGTTVAVFDRPDGIVVVDTGTGVSWTASQQPQGLGFVAVDLSADGRFVAFSDRTPDNNPSHVFVTRVGGAGYQVLDERGGVHAFGDAPALPPAAIPAGRRAVDLATGPSPLGMWVLDDAGEVHTLGDAPSLGGTVTFDLGPGEHATALVATPSGAGYWIVTDRGAVFARGDAVHHGGLEHLALNGPVADAVATETGGGYWLLGSDGGVFAFGDAAFSGSTGAMVLNEPVRGMVADPDGVGYWLVAADGGVFAFDAPFRGSVPGVLAPGQRLNQAVVAMVAYGNGYLLTAADGGVFNFSELPFSGSLVGASADPVTAIAAVG